MCEKVLAARGIRKMKEIIKEMRKEREEVMSRSNKGFLFFFLSLIAIFSLWQLREDSGIQLTIQILPEEINRNRTDDQQLDILRKKFIIDKI